MILEKTIIETEFRAQQEALVERIKNYLSYLDAMEKKIDVARTNSGYIKSLKAQREFITQVLGIMKISDDYIKILESNNFMLGSKLGYLQTANENQYRLLKDLTNDTGRTT